MKKLILILPLFFAFSLMSQTVILRVNHQKSNSYEFFYFTDSIPDFSKVDSFIIDNCVRDIVVIINDESRYLISCSDIERPFFLSSYSDSSLIYEDYILSDLLEYSLTLNSKP